MCLFINLVDWTGYITFRVQCQVKMQCPVFKILLRFQDGDSRKLNRVRGPSKYGACVPAEPRALALLSDYIIMIFWELCRDLVIPHRAAPVVLIWHTIPLLLTPSPLSEDPLSSTIMTLKHSASLHH